MSRPRKSGRDDLLILGTLVPATEESDAKKFVPVWKQQATSEDGRKRFHGAFTGGFSAGYFNTVGSKEGWAPSQFVSSREGGYDRRAAAVQRGIEDYMDEEDMRALKAATRLVAADEFDTLGSTEQEYQKRQQIYKGPTGETQLLAGTLLDEIIMPKREPIGLRLLRRSGWRGTMPHGAVSGRLDEAARAIGFGVQSSGPNSELHAKQSAGFGLSVLEEEDDEKVYDNDDMHQYSRFIETKPQTEQTPKTTVPTRQASKNAPACIVPGFRSASGNLLLEKTFESPKIPEGFVPRGLADQSSDDKVVKAQRVPSAEQRGEMLGEKPLPRARMSTLAAKRMLELDAEMNMADSPCQQSWILEKHVAEGALRGFMPFQAYPAKNHRYQGYLQFSAGVLQEPPEYPPNMAPLDIEHEKEEFYKAAMMYRPLPSAIASRFVSATKVLQPDTAISGLSRPTKKPDLPIAPQAASLHEDKSRTEATKEAISQKLFGKLTRTEYTWFPTSLLCKRFQVDDPYPDAEKSATAVIKPVLSESAMTKVLENSGLKVVPVSEEVALEGRTAVEDEGKNIDMLENLKRPPVDLFKAIFEDEDEDVEDDKEVVPSTILPVESVAKSTQEFGSISSKPSQARRFGAEMPPAELFTREEIVVVEPSQDVDFERQRRRAERRKRRGEKKQRHDERKRRKEEERQKESGSSEKELEAKEPKDLPALSNLSAAKPPPTLSTPATARRNRPGAADFW